MHNIIAIFAVLSVVFAIGQGIPYLATILQGKTKPHQLTWVVFTIMNAIVTISQFLAGARSSVLISLTFTIYCFIILLLSLKVGLRDTSRYDRLLFALSIITIIIYLFTRNNAVAIWLTVLIDIFATTMIVLKVRAQPNSEAAYPWAIGTAAYTFTILSLPGTPFGILYVRPIYGWFSDIAVVVAVWWYRVLKHGQNLQPQVRQSKATLSQYNERSNT